MKTIRGTIPAHILQQVTRLRSLEEAVHECLPADCCRHCRVAGVSDDTLLLVADSSAWRARVHFHIDQIISHFRELGKPAIRRVRVRVSARTDVQPPIAPGRPALVLPPESARAFAALARDTDDPGLREVLERLARHGSCDTSRGDP